MERRGHGQEGAVRSWHLLLDGPGDGGPREGAKAFYGGLLGWEAEDTPAGEAGTYTMLKVDGDEVCAL
jgi:hypothetical protein